MYRNILGIFDVYITGTSDENRCGWKEGRGGDVGGQGMGGLVLLLLECMHTHKSVYHTGVKAIMERQSQSVVQSHAHKKSAKRSFVVLLLYAYAWGVLCKYRYMQHFTTPSLDNLCLSMELNGLPEQIALYIFEFLTDKDICTLLVVNHKFKSLIDCDENTWRQLYIRKFGKAESEQDESDKDDLGWRASYILMKKFEHCKRKVLLQITS